jgi:ribosomal protein S18 acetylase RimI-like enzyme
MQATSLRWRGLIHSAERIRARISGPEDRALIDALFYEDRAAQFAGTGLAEAQIRPLIEMQARGRGTTYTEQYPAAEDWILLDSDGTPAGRLLLDRQPDRWRIVDIAVLTARRGQGLGAGALMECQRQAAAAGARLDLQVRPENPARRLYERLGFKVVREDAIAAELVWNPTAAVSA